MGGVGRSGLRFEVLGPLRVWQLDTEVTLGALNQRAVLAVLLLHANQPMGREQLINAVWGASAPAYVVNLLQKHVSGLRRVLEPDRGNRAPSQVLTWTDNGYLLTVPADELDLAQFERSIERARAAHTAGDLSGRGQALHKALALWRGPVCDGLTTPYLDRARDRLAERHIDILQERIDADLALGNHADLVAHLRQLVAEHPVRERLRGLLMLALYRSGRQADALAAFQDAREHLRDELGVDPGPELRQLHRQILAADPILATPNAQPAAAPAAAGTAAGAGAAAAAGAGASQPLPERPPPAAAQLLPPAAQLPPPAAQLPPPSQLTRGPLDFVGRAAELDHLDELLDDDAAGRSVVIAAVTGSAGVGKTALAVHWAHRVRHRFPDGQLYVNLRGFDPTGSATEPAEALRGFLEAFAVPPQLIPVSVEAQAALYRSLLTGRRVLVVLDNARSSDQVRALLPGSPGCFVVITSRDDLIGLVAEGAHTIPVDLLSAAESQLMLTRRLDPGRVEAEPEAVQQLAAACARLPLALSIVAARLAAQRRFPLAALADQIRQAQRALDAFDGADPATNVRAVFSWSYQTLSPPAARTFRLLGLHPGPDISVAAAASITGTSVRDVTAALTELTRAHLLIEHAPGRYMFHDLVLAYAAETTASVDTDENRLAARYRMFDHYLHTADGADLRLNPHRYELHIAPPQDGVVVEPPAGPDQAVAWFATEHAVLVAAVGLAGSCGFDAHAWQLAGTMATFLDRAGFWHDAVAVQLAGLAAASRTGDRLVPARAHRNAARAFVRLGRTEDAQEHLKYALDLYQEIDDRTGQARVHMNLARVAELDGRHHGALGHATRALELFRAEADLVGHADALNGVGWYLAQIGELDQALTHCEQALMVNHQTGDRVGEAHTWDSLGYVQHHLGRMDQAVICYEHAVRLRRDLGDRFGEAEALVRLGDTHQAADDPTGARARWQDALAVLDELNHPEADRLRGKLGQPRRCSAAGGCR